MASIHTLISVFDEVRRLLLLEDNSFDYSGWEDSAEACAEIDSVGNSLRSGNLDRISHMSFLFLPTGPLQEVSLSSGWGDKFVNLANRFDAAMQAEECACFQNSRQPGVPFSFVGSTSDYADITLGLCPQCGQNWLRYFYENEGFTGSGIWYLGAIAAEQADGLHVEQAKPILEGLEWYWYGGSYYGGTNGISRGSITH